MKIIPKANKEAAESGWKISFGILREVCDAFPRFMGMKEAEKIILTVANLGYVEIEESEANDAQTHTNKEGGMSTDYIKEICRNCGFAYGSHHAGQSPWPRDYCPGHEGRMDWENGQGTVFSPTGTYKEIIKGGE